jgi:hypothetical protein
MRAHPFTILTALREGLARVKIQYGNTPSEIAVPYGTDFTDKG